MAPQSSKRIITVFGASGFVGRHVVRRLVKSGWIVRAACRDPEHAHYLRTMGDVGQVIPWAADITNAKSVEAALNGASAAVNLVGILYQSGSATFERIHAEAAKTVAEAAAAAGIGNFVHMSALGADEESPSAYARTKAAGEKAVLAALPEAAIVRPSVVFGPEDNFFNMFAGLSRLSPFLPVIGAPGVPTIRFGGKTMIDVDLLGDGGTKFQPVYVGDVADAITACLEQAAARGKIFELVGPSVYSFADIMRLLLKTTGRKRLLLPIPLWLAELEGFFLGLLPKPLLTLDQVKLLQKDNVAGGTLPTQADLGIQSTPAEAVLPSYLRRFQTMAARERLT